MENGEGEQRARTQSKVMVGWWRGESLGAKVPGNNWGEKVGGVWGGMRVKGGLGGAGSLIC